MRAQPFSELEFRHMILNTAKGDIEGIFSELRLDIKTVPDGLIPYDIRHGDDDSVPCTLETHATVNYFGVFIVDAPLDFGNSDHIEILDRGFDEESDASPEWIKKYLSDEQHP